MTQPHPRAPTRTMTTDHEGWIRAQRDHQPVGLAVVGEAMVKPVCPPPPKASPPSILLGQSCYQADIVTFCSHIRHDPLLRRAYITEIQNRKSNRLPYLQEYLLLFFSTGQRRFVARVDYPSQTRASVAKSQVPVSGSSLGLGLGITVYHVTGNGEDHGPAPWFEDDGTRGSELVAALTTWADLDSAGTTFVSHHLSTARDRSSGRPSLQDICGLIEGVVLETPASYLKTGSSFVTARSALLVVQRCLPQDFACQLGEERDLVSASALEESAWSCLLRWYLPFTSVALIGYTLAVIALHIWVAYLLESSTTTVPMSERIGVLEAVETCILNPSAPECARPEVATAVWHNALRLMLHVVLDLPFPVGFLHAWLSAKELQIVALTRKVSARFLNCEEDMFEEGTKVKTWIGTFSRPWFNFVVTNCVGCLVGLALFFGILLGHGIIALLVFVVCIGVTANYVLPPIDSADELREDPEDGLPLLDCEAGAPPASGSATAGPSSSRF